MIPEDTKTNIKVTHEVGSGTLFFLMQLLLIILKAVNVISWSWLWILVPAFIIVGATCVGVFFGVLQAIKGHFFRS